MKTHATPYGPLANIYDGFLTLTGFKRGVENFLDRVEFELPEHAAILDAGCGTGLVSLYLARRYPSAHITATDIDDAMLDQMVELAEVAGIDSARLLIAKSDLASPHAITPRGGTSRLIPEQSLDAVIVSGALEHVGLDDSVQKLVRLIKPGGVFFNLGVRHNPAGAVLGMVYSFRPYSLAEMRSAYAKAGLHNIRALKLQAKDFPANLSRVAVIAKKPA